MHKTIARWAGIAIVALGALGAGLYFGAGVGRDSPAAGILELALLDTDGREQRLDQWQGKVLVVNFWATWCEPCREEMPEFVKAQAAFGARGLQFVGIAIDQPDKVRTFSQELKLNYPSLIGGYGALELSKSFGNRIMALPFTLIIDRKGQVAYAQMGPLKPGKLEAIVGELL